MIEVVKPGLETTVQDWPGRHGFWNKGFPVSGPMDSWSMRMANVLVGNQPGDAALEAQFMGPTLKFQINTVIAVCGSNMRPKLDGEPIELWQSYRVFVGQVLELTAAINGARAYIAIAGGIGNEVVLGSRSTFAKAGVGGIDGGALKAGQVLPVIPAEGTARMIVPEAARPKFSKIRTWVVEVCAGPNDDWIDKPGQDRFFSADWVLSAKSDRTGFRLDGPEWSFAPEATNKPPEHGTLPSNIIDHGYPMGAINLAGQTPIILMNDGPSMGGFINPYTVPTASFWKLGQARPGETLNFQEISVKASQKIAADVKNLCSQETLLKMD